MTEQDKPAPPIEVRGLTEADYIGWRHHPVTKWFLAYLHDYRADLVVAANDQWLGGDLELSTADQMKGRINCLEEVATLPFAAIANFYSDIDHRERKDEDEDAG